MARITIVDSMDLFNSIELTSNLYMAYQEENTSQKQKDSKIQSFLATLNTFKVGFISGLLITFLASIGVGHLFLNIFKLGSVSIGDKSFGQVASPVSSTDDSNVQDVESSQIEQNDGEVQNSEGINQAIDGTINQESSNNRTSNELGSNLENSEISGETVSVTINYNSNADLPGFDPNKGYVETPPDIGQFNDAILITNVGLGSQYATFSTREVFINKKKYDSTFSLITDGNLPTRVSFNLELPGVKADGVFLQFGLADLSSGTTTLTYLVNVFGDGEILWSNQIKYEESQISSVVLNTTGIQDIYIEYQVVESAGISNSRLRNYPLYFTEAKVLEN
ncbi:hypothetical protein U2F10_06775 [Leptothoe sp. EHU-05/26/07-4]